ncbi:MAG: GNAT family N-acetyltransferase [Bacteroidetes bacterium]|nr:GNAT family N-acetyltransferase [Bacteroidota bacterium]
MTETKRFILKPLTYNQLVKYIRADNSLERELGLSPMQRIIPAELKEALEKNILPGVADASKNYLYYTIWTIISKKENKMVGDICFYGEPDANGEVEIGYGTYSEFQGKGYMTEAVKGIINWAANEPGIKKVKASTDKDNIASWRVLEKNNFVQVSEKDDLLLWKLNVK